MIKKVFSFSVVTFLLLFTVTSTAFAQRVELTAMGGYQYWGAYKYSSYYNGANYGGKLALGDGPCYGGILGFEVRDNVFAELVYNHQDSRLVDKPSHGYENTLTNVGVNYFQLNGTHTVSVNDKVEPYATLGLGAVLFDPTENKYSSLWKFSMNFGAGIKYFISDKVGLRLGAGFWAPIQGAGIGVGVGTGGAYAGASTYTTIIQMNVAAGLILRLK